MRFTKPQIAVPHYKLRIERGRNYFVYITIKHLHTATTIVADRAEKRKASVPHNALFNSCSEQSP